MLRKKFPFIVKTLIKADCIQELWGNKGLHFEHLTNTDVYSVRLNIVWRLEMNIKWTNDDCTVGIIGLTDLSHHYGGKLK